jgi:hypothetical protein
MLRRRIRALLAIGRILSMLYLHGIFAAIVECYSVDQPGKEEESSDKREEIEQIEDVEALRMVEIEAVEATKGN